MKSDINRYNEIGKNTMRKGDREIKQKTLLGKQKIREKMKRMRKRGREEEKKGED
jgi:hypothetical protein